MRGRRGGGRGPQFFLIQEWNASVCQFVTWYCALFERFLNEVDHAFFPQGATVGVHCTSVTVGTLGGTGRLSSSTHNCAVGLGINLPLPLPGYS